MNFYDNLAIFPDKLVMARAFKDFKEKYEKGIVSPLVTLMKKRTPLLEALIHEYFSERIVERKKAGLVEGLTYVYVFGFRRKSETGVL